MVEVVTVYTPRPLHPKWRDYLAGMHLQRKSAEKFGCRHTVVSDVELDGFNVLKTVLPSSLMHAIIVGQLAFLEQWDDSNPLVLVDADCLINRDLSGAFEGEWDIGLTWRPIPPLNNGAMYVQVGRKQQALAFFRHALSLCREHWGGDQEAITLAASPIPDVDKTIGERQGVQIGFLPMKKHNCSPKREGVGFGWYPFIVHFKGEHAKDWMQTHYDLFLA